MAKTNPLSCGILKDEFELESLGKEIKTATTYFTEARQHQLQRGKIMRKFRSGGFHFLIQKISIKRDKSERKLFTHFFKGLHFVPHSKDQYYKTFLMHYQTFVRFWLLFLSLWNTEQVVTQTCDRPRANLLIFTVK